jgi:hypothetical protein
MLPPSPQGPRSFPSLTLQAEACDSPHHRTALPLSHDPYLTTKPIKPDIFRRGGSCNFNFAEYSANPAAVVQTG